MELIPRDFGPGRAATVSMSDGTGANLAEPGEANSNVRDPSSVTSTESGEASAAARDSSSVTQTESEETNSNVRDPSSVATHGDLGPQAQGTVVTEAKGSGSPGGPDRDTRIATAKQLLTYVNRVCNYQLAEEVRRELETIYMICEKSIQTGPALEHDALRVMDERLEELEKPVVLCQTSRSLRPSQKRSLLLLWLLPRRSHSRQVDL